ncbi:type I secretion system permease/ATPase [Methyloceanibacter marginalis]|jgi:ATP-binding cassette, subfamily C, type I secretion system permease/ATPase|uniref:type I secretion system permease/ATPase n=1 Tax=Methyloceanibacter marginalis TaxID=1774971 RepID=UPI001876F226|nr:type I secretion system permease/ATPase [Methyloceanibacter marginalis]
MANKSRNSPRKGDKNGFDAGGASPVDSASSDDETETVKEAGAGNGKGNGALGNIFDGIKSRARVNGANGANGHGANGANGTAPIGGRVSSMDFRGVLTKGLASCRRNLATVAVFSFVVNLLVLAIPVYLFNISDRVLTSQSMDTLVMLTIVVVGAIGAHVLLDLARRTILMRVAVDLESHLGAPVLSAAARSSQNGSSREFQILSELQHLRSFITGPVLLTMLDMPVVPIYLIVVFLVHPHLGFIVLGTGIVLLILALLNQKFTAVHFGRANAFGTRANLQADAMARNAQVMNAMGMVPEGVSIWGGETAESLKSQVSAQDRNIWLTALSKFVRLCTQIAILGWGAYLATQGHLTGGMIIAASIVGSRALSPIEGTIEGWRNFVQARSAFARVKKLLQSSPLNFDRLRLPRPKGHLIVDRILYVPQPAKKVILNGVSFELQPGESLGIVGASGTGKSTLGKMLVGSIFPTAGNVRLDMMDLRNWDPRQLGENVGYLPQDVQLFPASIKENIARMRKDASDESIFDAAEIADVHGMVSEFAQGYETQVSMDGTPLSGGQKQRIGLARAFFGDPQLVVLDEPNSNLDPPGERALARALGMAKDKQITVIAITQRPSLLRSVDKIMILTKGTVQALGERNDIIPLLTARKELAAQKAETNGGEANYQAEELDDLNRDDE